MSTRTRTSRKFRAYSTSLKNWYWSILKKFWMWIQLKVHLLHDQVIQWVKAQVRVYSDSVLCLGKMNENRDAITIRGRWSGRIQNVPFHKELLGIGGEAIESEWNIFQGFSSLQILQEIQNGLRKRNTEPEIITDRIIFMSSVQRHRLDNERKWWNLYFEFRWSQGIREEILARTLDVSGSWRRKEVVWRILEPFQWRMGLHSDSNGGTIQRCRSSSIKEYWSFESWNSEEEWQETPHTSMRMLRTQNSCSESFTLWIRLSLYGAVASWCEQFGQENRNNLWPKVYWQVWNHKK